MLARNEDYVDLSRPSVEGLIYALRHREVWPNGFRWFFPDCKHCALGLASAIWGKQVTDFGIATSFDLLKALGIIQAGKSYLTASEILDDGEVAHWRQIFMHGSTETRPQDIAARLESALLARVEQKILELA